ncbi:MAG: ABC transporter permease subunit [Streptosporangiales bacterium]|nr:ABC transporter permease subunit [Streptosporangiales bacterium]
MSGVHSRDHRWRRCPGEARERRTSAEGIERGITVYSIPKVTLYPIFLLLLGIGEVSRIGFAFIHGFLPMILIVMGATSSVDRIHLKLAASIRMGMLSMIRRILVPSILPALSTGMRLSFGLTFLGLILAEMFSGGTGLGYELLRNVTLVRMEDIVGEVVLVAAIALIPTGLLQMIERRVHSRYEGGTPALGRTAL